MIVTDKKLDLPRLIHSNGEFFPAILSGMPNLNFSIIWMRNKEMVSTQGDTLGVLIVVSSVITGKNTQIFKEIALNNV